jgi:hypothetical protein
VHVIGYGSLSVIVPSEDNNLAFVHNFGYSFSIGLGTSRRISNALPSLMLHVAVNLDETL